MKITRKPCSSERVYLRRWCCTFCRLYSQNVQHHLLKAAVICSWYTQAHRVLSAFYTPTGRTRARGLQTDRRPTHRWPSDLPGRCARDQPEPRTDQISPEAQFSTSASRERA